MSDIVLYALPGRPWGMPNLSPFCSKLETYLRFTKASYRLEHADMRKAPGGKVPYVDMDGTLLGDSQLIIEELERRAGVRALDADLGPAERATGHLVRRALDEGFHFAGMYLRWMEDDAFARIRPEFEKVLPKLLRPIVPLIRRSTRKKLEQQGTGKHPPEAVAKMAFADIDALSDFLGEKEFFLGERPRTVDASAFAFLEMTLAFPGRDALMRHASDRPNLVAYRRRVRERYWSDLPAS